MATQLRLCKIDTGIGKYEVDDYYAVLGIPLNSSPLVLRERYITLAKELHPDVNPTEKANQYFAKLVNPAYEILQQDRERSEYLDLLRLLAKRLLKQSLKDFVPRSEAAKKLITTPTVTVYERLVKEIACSQLQDLDRAMEYISWLSELNLIYLLLQEGYRPGAASKMESASTVKYEDFKTVKDVTNPKNVTQHIAKAQEHMKAQLWTMALQELRAAIQLDPKHSLCHSLLGQVYLHQNLVGMAKVSFQQALKYNPKDTIALEGMKEIEKINQQKGLKEKENTKAEKSGFFGWLGNRK